MYLLKRRLQRRWLKRRPRRQRRRRRRRQVRRTRRNGEFQSRVTSVRRAKGVTVLNESVTL